MRGNPRWSGYFKKETNPVRGQCHLRLTNPVNKTGQFCLTLPPNASSLIPIAASIARANSLASAVGRSGGSSCANLPSKLSNLGPSCSPKPKNPPASVRMMGSSFYSPCSTFSPVSTTTSCRSKASDGGSLMSSVSPGLAILIQASSTRTAEVAS